MSKMQKWNPIKREYSSYSVPDSWNCPLYSENMHEVVNCADCGKELEYGDCYTSRFIHNTHGDMGYKVCEICYEIEIIRTRLTTFFNRTEEDGK